MTQLANIDHVVVLMLENRSFDNLLGRLYPKSSGFDGLAGNETNLDGAGAPVAVWNDPGLDDQSMRIPDPDPGELWVDINTQIFGAGAPGGAAAAMVGFVRNYLGQTAEPAARYVAKNIMHYFTPDQVPVLSKLARQFAVCDRWFASAPCQTWPNRFFVHTGTANGYENNDPPHFPYTMETIFNRLEEANQAWKIYFHDIAQSKTLAKLWLHADHFRFYDELRQDAASGDLPSYAFVEPRYFPFFHLPNDQHPPHVVTLGEQLIADVYNSLRAGPAWPRTLLVITYDEHGGCYDHVPPPPAKAPGLAIAGPFGFDRYGVRVPAVIVSPYVAPGTVLRPGGAVPFDHTSILATVRKRFGLGAPLSERDAVAPDLDDVLSLPQPSNLGPPSVAAHPYVPTPTDVALAQQKPLNAMQRGLVKLAANLPSTSPGTFEQDVRNHIRDLEANGMKEADAAVHQSAEAAAGFVKTRLGGFFRGL